MKCPYCGDIQNKVIDSRLSKDNAIIRRRRECEVCNKRFTTHERVEEMLPLIVKKDGRREPFDRDKIINGLKKACQKRPVSVDAIEKLVDKVEQYLQESGDREIKADKIGQIIMDELRQLDEVAYVRFASVYRSFRDINEFMSELKDMLDKR